MMNRRIGICLLLTAAALAAGNLLAGQQDDAEACRQLAARYDRSRSRVLARHVERPTRARLDYAAYDRNILLHVPEPARLAAPARRPALGDLHFGGALVAGSLRDRLAETPLTAGEQAEPLAMGPLLDYLAVWDFDAAEKLLVVASRVSEEKWGNAGHARSLQRLTTGYLHTAAGGGVELWVKVEFEPNVAFLQGVTDEDGDGYREIYGRVPEDAISSALVRQLREDYIGRLLDAREVETYFYELTSAWYEAHRTELLKPEDARPWPSAATEPEVREELAGLTLRRPTAVLRGTPFGKPLYNVFVVGTPPADPPRREAGPAPAGWQPVRWTTPAPDPLQANRNRFRQELQQWGGSWSAWERRLAPFQGDVRRQLQARPAEVRGIVGRDGFLFFRGSLEYVLAGDLQQQRNDRNPFPAIVDYHRQLQERGIDLLLVIIPAKPEVHPEKLSAAAPAGGRPYAQPYTRKLMLELTEAGVEVLDLLPAFLAARDRSPEPFYMTQDTHWSPTAVREAARLIGDRVKQYPWLGQARPQSTAYTLREVSFTRAGDVRGMLPEAERLRYRPLQLTAQQVLGPGGRPYEDDPESPIVVLGDSFCGVFHFEDCKHAGLTAHLAREIGMPVDLIMAHGSGPRIRTELSRRGAAAVNRKKLVIWTVIARDLHDYWAPWEQVKLP